MKANHKGFLTVLLAVFCMGATGCKLEDAESIEANVQLRAVGGGGERADGLNLPEEDNGAQDAESYEDDNLPDLVPDDGAEADEPVAAMPEEHEDDRIREEEPNEEWPDELPGGDEEREDGDDSDPRPPEHDQEDDEIEPEDDPLHPPQDEENEQDGCVVDLDACLEANEAVDPALEEACHAEFEACLADEDIDHDGVEREPWPEDELENDPCQEEAERCLDELGEGDAENFQEERAEACFDAMDACYEAEAEGGDIDEPAPQPEPEDEIDAVCEAPLDTCLEEAGEDENNAQACFEAFDTCIDEKFPADPAEQLCFEDFQVCADALAEDDHAGFDLCIQTEMDCLDAIHGDEDGPVPPLPEEPGVDDDEDGAVPPLPEEPDVDDDVPPEPEGDEQVQ